MTNAEDAPNPEGIPFIITMSMRAVLQRLGYDYREITVMTPAQAHQIISTGQAKSTQTHEANDNAQAEPVEAPHIETVGDYIAPTRKQVFKHKGRGHSPEISIKRDRNAPPKGEPFVWLTKEMLESPAWRSLPPAAKQVIERIALEHMHHAGTENGKLPVTYDNFEAYGVRRMSIKFGIMAAEALGFIAVTEEGYAGAGDTRRAARYALQWVDRHDGAPRSNRWKVFETLPVAEAAVGRVRDRIQKEAARRKGSRSSPKRAGTLKAVG